jgi:hypothetical protein
VARSRAGQTRARGVSCPFGGTVLKTSLSTSDEKELAEELSGQS